jgi:hypothetical protein
MSTGADGDLDALMGRLELEAARRRAVPGFPIDADARLGADLDGLGPHRPPTVTDALRALVAALPVPDTPPPAPALPTSAMRRILAGRSTPAPSAGDVAAALRRVGLAVVDVAAALAARLDRLEAGPTTARAAAPAGEGDDGRAAWAPLMLELLGEVAPDLAAGGGRVWWSGPEPLGAAALLRAAGADAYGTDPAGPAWATGTDGRRADPLEHLGALAGGALGAAVLAGPLPGAGADRLAAVCDGLTRTAPVAVVVSPTVQWWRELVGPVTADLAADRPLGADTWTAALAGRGWKCRIDAGHGGRTYRLRAQRP